MGPNPVLGTDVGKAYASQEGGGFASILGPSRAADTYVTMRREQLANERQSEAAAAKQKAEEISKSMQALMKTPDYYTKYDDEVLGLQNEARTMGAELFAEGLNPFAVSNDPRVREFQTKWDQFQSAAKTSLLVKEYDTEMVKTLSAKDSPDVYNIEGFQQVRQEFFGGRSLLDIAKEADNFPRPESRWGIAESYAKLGNMMPLIFKGKTNMTDEEILTGLAPILSDPASQRWLQPLIQNPPGGMRTEAPTGAGAMSNAFAAATGQTVYGDLTKSELYNQSALSGTTPVQYGALMAVKNMMDKKSVMDAVSDEIATLRSSIGKDDWGTKEEDLRKKPDEFGRLMISKYPWLLNENDVDGLPIATGATLNEKIESGARRIGEIMRPLLAEDDRNPNREHQNRMKEKDQPAIWEDFDVKIRERDSKARGMLRGVDIGQGYLIADVDFIPTSDSNLTQDIYKVRTKRKVKDPNDPDSYIYENKTFTMDRDEWMRISFRPWMQETNKKQSEAVSSGEGWQEFNGPDGEVPLN